MSKLHEADPRRVSWATRREHGVPPSSEHVWSDAVQCWVIPRAGTKLDLARRKPTQVRIDTSGVPPMESWEL